MPKSKKWALVDGRATLRRFRGPRSSRARANSDPDNVEDVCMVQFSEGAFIQVMNTDGKVEVQRECVTARKEEKLLWHAVPRDPLDGPNICRRKCRKD